ncbi:hypothetical protein EIN_098500 [Entamoeba invadens IP1]|uniref:Uncharacterized protein n=1 Tax=Entamoeba invadens IP1 TaxID=370355 RepID=A0A0A1U481_ENTIV|nr:hypothetical protein EIN_098500 [Entamoeba invadens IP1]ELP87523.1 hypothetical protein EIN_098500 [Entamoeba invadens IP1]|eukprot:XP_004254294.1 hypothetical protein EIN_098500 [Entamoeba invadens IP1]
MRRVDMSSELTKNKYQAYKNYQVYQEAVLIDMLVPFCDIVFGRPSKRTTTTLQFLFIKELRFDGYVVDVSEFIESRCEDISNMEKKKGVKEKTSMRRCENNKFTECLHLLIDILTELGYFFNTSKSQGKNGIAKSETIQRIFKDNKCLFSKQEIMGLGKEIHQRIVKTVTSNPNFVLTANEIRPNGTLSAHPFCQL